MSARNIILLRSRLPIHSEEQEERVLGVHKQSQTFYSEAREETETVNEEKQSE